MNKKTFYWAAALIVLLAIAYFAYQLLSSSYQPQKQNGDSAAEKTAAPDFTVYDADGGEVHLSDFLGKPVILNFWASWCPPCKGEMPDFNTVYEEQKDNAVFLMVDMVDGWKETGESGAQYVSEQGYAFPVYFDTEQDAAATYGITSIPSTVIIDQDGYIVVGYKGPVDEEALRTEIEALLQAE